MCWSWRSTLGWPICSHHNLRGLSQEPPQLPVPLAWPGTAWQPCALLVPGLWYVGGGSQLDLRKVSAKTLNDLLPGKLPRPPVLNAFLRELRGPSQTGRGVHVRDLGESLCFPSTHPTVRTMLCFLFWATCNRYFLIWSTGEGRSGDHGVKKAPLLQYKYFWVLFSSTYTTWVYFKDK